MRTITTLEVANDVLQSLQLKTKSAIGSDLLSQQLVTAINWAWARMFSKGSCYWDEYMGTFISVNGKRSYDLTPENYNYCPATRDFVAATTISNVTAYPNNLISWDDTYSLTRFIATGSSPSVKKISVGTLNSGRITGSVWVQASTSLPPGTVTLTLMDGAGSQLVSKTITPGSVANRYAISGYFNASSTTVQLQVSWTSATGSVRLDAMQIEKSDWATEYFDNPSTTTPTLRTMFAAPDRLIGVGKYQPGTTIIEQDIYILDTSLYPNERAVRPMLVGRTFFSMKGGKVNLENLPEDTHLVYRARRVPPKLTLGTDLVYMPDPWYWVLVRGANAFLQAAMYDIGANADSRNAETIFDAIIEETLAMADPIPDYTYVSNNYPRMMR